MPSSIHQPVSHYRFAYRPYADAADASSWLQGLTPRNRPCYRHFGYRVAASLDEATIAAGYALMPRPGGARK